MKCGYCKYFHKGQCRYNPPTDDGFPSTHPEDWCSKYRIALCESFVQIFPVNDAWAIFKDGAGIEKATKLQCAFLALDDSGSVSLQEINGDGSASNNADSENFCHFFVGTKEELERHLQGLETESHAAKTE